MNEEKKPLLAIEAAFLDGGFIGYRLTFRGEETAMIVDADEGKARAAATSSGGFTPGIGQEIEYSPVLLRVDGPAVDRIETTNAGPPSLLSADG